LNHLSDLSEEFNNLSSLNQSLYVTQTIILLSVGGIYTVIRSKAYVSTEEMGDQYCLIGPYKEHLARTEIEEADFPPHNPLHQAVQILRDQGYKVCYL